MATTARMRGQGNFDRLARERRQRIVLGVALALLALLLVIEGPKTLRQLRGTPATAPATSANIGNTSQAGSTSEAARPTLETVLRFPEKDPFLVQIGRRSSAGPVEASVQRAPVVRLTRFVPKDPFTTQLAAPHPAPDSPPPARGPARVGGGGYIVVLASIPTVRGMGAAKAVAAQARAAGVHPVGVVDSTNYATLRSGYYAVYSGTYASVGGVLKALNTARGVGYGTAYTRRLGK